MSKTWFFSTRFFLLLLVVFFSRCFCFGCVFGFYFLLVTSTLVLFALVSFPFGIGVVLSTFVYPGHLALFTLFWCSSHMVLLFFAHWWWFSSYVGATIFLALVLPFFLHYCCGLCCVRVIIFFMLVLHWYYNSFHVGDVARFVSVL